EELDEDDDEGWYEHELVGLEARVGSQVVGKIAALHTMPVQDLLVVEAPDGKEILIPFVEQIVPEVNVAEGFVLLTPPDGLFDINTDDAGAAGPGDNA
ncbi:MAG TPA: PRC-barrel domain-containing protein, partial [Arthrobacter sp.]|nr:PRC-barrel domain-containing protein [Arthrobacter sp.]